MRLFFPVVWLALLLWWLGLEVVPAEARAEAITRVEVAQESHSQHVSGPDGLEMEADALGQVITNQIHAFSQSASSKPQAEHQNLLLGIVLVIGGLIAVTKLGIKFAAYANRRHDPWRGRRTCKEDAAAEEKSFSEFAAAFSRGPEPAAATPAAPAGAGGPEPADKQAEPPRSSIESFLQQSAKRLAEIRKLFSAISRAAGPAANHPNLVALRDEIRALRQEADLPAARPVWQATSALDGLLQQLVERPHHVTPSTLRTVAGAIDLLHALRLRGLDPELASQPPVRLLVVDDDAIGRHAVSFSLKKVFSPPDLASDGESALALTEANAYDVIFLDVQMPGMDGFEVCSRVHGTVPNATTPVVFVTCRTDFDARARSMVIGGQDLIAKPFLTFELTVKALTLVLRRRIEVRAPVREALPQAPGDSTPPELKVDSSVVEPVEAISIA